jgi:hypothetical protein
VLLPLPTRLSVCKTAAFAPRTVQLLIYSSICLATNIEDSNYAFYNVFPWAYPAQLIEEVEHNEGPGGFLASNDDLDF